jgi:excinuclease ABC subunit C
VDISVLGGEEAVGSLVKFLEGAPDKSGYRRYRIKSVAGVNDYEMMCEVLDRRFTRALREGGPLPDLLVVDGGKGQLQVALSVLRELGIKDLAVAALAKDRSPDSPGRAPLKKTGERLFLPGIKDPIVIKPGSTALLLLQHLRDEAHRFALSYHKLLRSRKTRRSVLEDIPGIGPKRSRALLQHFGGLARLREAPAAEIAQAGKISEALAGTVKERLAGLLPQADPEYSG